MRPALRRPAIVWATHLALFVCIRATEGFAGLGSRIRWVCHQYMPAPSSPHHPTMLL